MKLSDLYKLQQNAARAAALSRQWEKQKRKLLSLPAQLGFNTIRELQAALAIANGDNLPPTHSVQAKARKKRIVITPILKVRLKELVEAKHTGAEIARILNVAPATVQNIKNELGLVRKRSKARRH